MGVGFTIAPFISILYGEHDSLAMEKLLNRGVKLGMAICLCTYIVLFVLAYPICLLFGLRDSQAINTTMMAIRVGASSIILGTVNIMFRYYYQSISKIWIANVLTVCKSCLYPIICMCAFRGVLGINAVWGSSLFAEIFTLLTTCIIVRLCGHKNPNDISNFMLLPKDFDEDYPVYEVSVENDVTKVVELANNIQGFCLQNGVSERNSFYMALCIEEMAGNVVKHGFKEGENHYIDIKITVKDNGIVFRMRDDGIQFNPFTYLKEDNNGDEFDRAANIGIRMVKKIAAKVDYRYSVGLNYLFVTI
jgi:anti-sigma regulatory factor (Ser/Thr protein kinase)